jgi:hypothetical protein
MDYSHLNLDSDEHVILEVRKHWIVFATHAAGLLMGGFMPFILFAALRMFAPALLTIPLPGNASALFTFFFSLWLLFLWVSFFTEWTKYFLDVWYVTEKRIIDVEQKRLFDREISNVRFDKIEDVTIDISGLLATTFNFGTVKVDTAAEVDGDFTLTMVRDPNRVREVIFDQHNEAGDTILKHASANTPE